MSERRRVLEEALRLEQSGEPAVMVTLVESGGSTPRHDVARMVVRSDGSIVGTIGGGAVEHEMRRRALEVLAGGDERPAVAEAPLADLGMVCGGMVKVLLEPIGVCPPLIIFGAGHVAEQLAPVAARCGFAVHVVDDRPEYASSARFPQALSLTHSFVPRDWSRLPLDRRSYCVVVTRGHANDYEVVHELAGRELAYVGMIGSKAKVAHTKTKLREAGLSDEVISRIHSPIGIDIGSETPAEIAVSIVAEMIQVRRRRG